LEAILQHLKPVFLPLGVVGGLACTAGISMLATLSAYTTTPWRTAPADWGEQMLPIYRDWLRVEYRTDGLVAPVTAGEFAIVISNHPSNFGNALLCHFLGQHITSHYYPVTKHDLEWIIRAPLSALGISVPIDRNDRVGAKQAVAAALPELTKAGGALLLFPDGTRPSVAKRLDAKRKWAGRIAELNSWSTLPPRSGVLLTLLQNLEQPVRIFNLTQAFNVVDEDWLDVERLYGSRYYLEAEEFMSSMLPQTEEGLQAWLLAEWRRKNRQIAAWRQE
jgi:1-acyl-sn-glycerol-3-phosphate acyltransferase